METDRLLLHNQILSLYPGLNVYFRPSSTFQLEYPCIVYNRTTHPTTYANDTSYRVGSAFDVVLLTTLHDIVTDTKAMLGIPGCSFKTTYITNDIVHNVYTIVIT